MILEIRGPDGTVVWQAPGTGRRERPISPQTAFLVSDILAGNTDPKQNPIWAEQLALRNGQGGTRRPAAVKTGTTNDARDLATYGFLPPHDGRPARPGRRGLDGQQRPLGAAHAEAGDLAHGRRPAVARLRPRLHEGLARRQVHAARRASSGAHRRVVRRSARAVDAGHDARSGSSPAPSRASKAVDQDGLLYRRRAAAGGSTRSRRSSDRGRGTSTSRTGCAGRAAAGASRAASTRGRPTSGAASWGGPLAGACAPDRRRAAGRRATVRAARAATTHGKPEQAARSRRAPRRRRAARRIADALEPPVTCAPTSRPGPSGGWASPSASPSSSASLTLGVAAGGVLLLLFLAILLASALEPLVGWHPRPAAARAGRDDPARLPRRSSCSSSGSPSSSCPAAIRQAEDIVASLPPFLDQARAWAGDLRPAAPGDLRHGAHRLGRRLLQPPPPPDPDTVVEVGPAVAEAAVALATLLTIVFFWLVEHARLQRYVLAFLPAERRAGARDAWNEIETRLGLWVRGQLILMGAMGLATGIAYTLLGLPGALLLGLIAALTEAIPIVGPLLGAIPAVLVAATVSPELALVVAGVYVVLQFVEGSVLVPLVMRNTVGISPLLVLVSLLIGAAVGGFVGAFLAVPIAASIEIVLSRLQARETPVAQDPAAIETPDEEVREGYERSLPDAGEPASVG